MVAGEDNASVSAKCANKIYNVETKVCFYKSGYKHIKFLSSIKCEENAVKCETTLDAVKRIYR